MGLASYVFDTTPEEMQSIVLTLDSMMATWEMQGIRVGYNRTLDPLDADPDQDSGLPDIANETVYLNLGIAEAPSYGKAIPQALAFRAKQGYDALLGLCLADPPQMQFKGNLPIGAGWKRRDLQGGPFVRPPQDLLTTGPDGLLEFDGPVPI